MHESPVKMYLLSVTPKPTKYRIRGRTFFRFWNYLHWCPICCRIRFTGSFRKHDRSQVAFCGNEGD